MPIRDMEDPNRAKLRRDNDEPILAKLAHDGGKPGRTVLCSSTNDPDAARPGAGDADSSCA